MFKKHLKFQYFREIFYCGMTRNRKFVQICQKHESGCFYTMSVHKNYFKKEKYGTESV